MSDVAPVSPARAPRKSRRVFEYLLVLIVIVGVVAVAMYQEQIRYFLALRMWNRSGPGDAVATFLASGQKGNRAGADAMLADHSYQSLNENGRWVGYYIATPAGKMYFRFSDMTPAGGPKITGTDYVLIGDGAAEVTALDRLGKPEKYRLQMEPGGWKISEMLGGSSAH